MSCRRSTVANIDDHLPIDVLPARQTLAMDHLRQLGITFNVYGHDDGIEKVWPMDILARANGHIKKADHG